MTIRNDYFGGGTDWSAGDTLFAADLNDTFDSAYDQAITDGFRVLGSDTTAATATSSWTEFVSYSVGANAVKNFVMLKALVDAWGNEGDWDGNSDASFRIKVDGSVVFTKSPWATIGESDAANIYATDMIVRFNSMFDYVYEPSAGEKSSGFTISLEGLSETGVSTRVVYAGYTQSWLMGA